MAEAILASGDADLVSMARPMLADAEFANKAREGRADEINVCIACNQACLDLIFSKRVATCLVNPKAGREIEFDAPPPASAKQVAVVGAGPAGLACAVTAAERGHRVTLYEADARIGGQLNLARNVPGKEEFDETLRYYRTRIERLGIDLHLGQRPSAEALAARGFDEIVIATGVTPRLPDIPGIDHASCASYVDILNGKRSAGRRVAIMGAGGIGFDVAEFLTSAPQEVAASPAHFRAEWGVDANIASRGGLAKEEGEAPSRQVVMLQRKSGRMGRGLGVSTGWVLRLLLAKRKVAQVTGVAYRRIDDAGVHITVEGEERVIPADTIVICAGQEPARSLYDELTARGVEGAHHRRGGARRRARRHARHRPRHAARVHVLRDSPPPRGGGLGMGGLQNIACRDPPHP